MKVNQSSSPTTRNVAIVLAGGSGRRMGLDRPKQWTDLAGRPVISYCLDAFERNEHIDEIAVVVSDTYRPEMERLKKRYSWSKLRHILLGGAERSDSSLSAIHAYANAQVNLIFHDAARPLVSDRIIDDVAEALTHHEAVGVGLPSVDTLMEVHDGYIHQVPDRSKMQRMQTPQAFRNEVIAEAYRRAKADPNFKATDDCGVVLKYLPETPIATVEGEERNLKLTYATDFRTLERYLADDWTLTDAALTNADAANNASAAGRMRYVKANYKTHLRQLQHAQLEVLLHVARICERHDITYWLDSGTLLGAVRHGGFIPWDDDIDICMPQEDLARFAEVAQKELPPHLFVQTPESEPEMRLPICKVRNLNSFFVEGADDFSKSYAKGIYIDIFPMMPWPTFPKRFSKTIAKGYCRANAILHAQHTYSWRSACELFYFGAKRALYWSLWHLGAWFTSTDKYYSNTLNNSGNGNRHLRSTIFPLSTITFEGEKFAAPADVDTYLRDLFGDYMQLPPEDQREGHATFFATKLVDEPTTH